jgi:hypothetical protein
VSTGPGRAATAKVHQFDPDPETPGTCRCRLIRKNAAHDPTAVAALQDQAHTAAAEDRRRLGERED